MKTKNTEFDFGSPQLPAYDRFPINYRGEKTNTLVKQEINVSTEILIITGFSSLDYIIRNFGQEQIANKRIRIVLGNELIPSNSTKLSDIKESYHMYLDIISGLTDNLDDKSVQFGNCGIPLAFGNLRVWKNEPKKFIL